MKTSAASLAFLAMLALSSATVAQSTWYVGTNPNPPGSGTSSADPYTSIQYAIDRPSTLSGDTVLVEANRTYFENVNYHGKNLIVQSDGGPVPPGTLPPLATIDGGSNGPCAQFTSSEGPAAVLNGFRLIHGLSTMGGGILIYVSSPLIRNCTIEENVATSRGGGIHVGFSSPTIENCVMANNRLSDVSARGGGLYSMYGFNLTIRNCTIYGNDAPFGGGIGCDYGGNVTITNTILWNDSVDELAMYAASPSFSYCDVQGGLAGAGNIDVDPVWWNRWGGNFLLNYGSPCIDAGDPASPIDPDGSRADIGAHAFLSGNQNGALSFCAGDGIDLAVSTACPCLNYGAPGHGCAHSASAHGGVLTRAGTTNPDTMVLYGYGMPSSSGCIYLKGSAAVAAGAVFGDGISCMSGTLIRLKSKTNVGGASQFPEAGDSSLSVRGATPPGSGLTGYYQTYYRNAAAAFCPPATFNITNGYVITW